MKLDKHHFDWRCCVQRLRITYEILAKVGVDDPITYLTWCPRLVRVMSAIGLLPTDTSAVWIDIHGDQGWAEIGIMSSAFGPIRRGDEVPPYPPLGFSADEVDEMRRFMGPCVRGGSAVSR